MIVIFVFHCLAPNFDKQASRGVVVSVGWSNESEWQWSTISVYGLRQHIDKLKELIEELVVNGIGYTGYCTCILVV